MDPETLIEGLRRPDAYPHPVRDLQVHETHISWVVTTGRYAYKIKKPVRLPFVDFSTLDRRAYFCREELRLNRRTAPALYLEVLPVTGSPGSPRIGGDGTPIDYALKMRQFDADDRLDCALASNRLTWAQLSRFAATLADFQRSIDRSKSADYGRPEIIVKRLEKNAGELADVMPAQAATALRVVAEWLSAGAAEVSPLLAARAEAGTVREGHGDMHLGNLVLIDGEIVPFDCIEFDEALRWIDVLDEVAFVVMDLESRGRADLAYVLLDAYLQETGDYDGMQLMSLYCAHRALVRAKVACLSRAPEGDTPDRPSAGTRLLNYARRLSSPRRPLLVLMHGLPASGKSRVASSLVAPLPGLRVSSDVERKRAAGLDRHARSGSGTGRGLYSETNKKATYTRLREIAGTVLGSGRNVIVDATFASGGERAAFIALARKVDADVKVVHCEAPMAELERRVEQRSRHAADSEADLTVLRYASARFEPASEAEGATVVRVDTMAGTGPEALVKSLRTGRSDPD